MTNEELKQLAEKVTSEDYEPFKLVKKDNLHVIEADAYKLAEGVLRLLEESEKLREEFKNLKLGFHAYEFRCVCDPEVGYFCAICHIEKHAANIDDILKEQK